MITLAGKVWKMDISGSISALARSGVMAPVQSEEVANHLGFLAQLAEVSETWESSLANDRLVIGDAFWLRHDMHIGRERDQSRWRAGTGQFVGYLPKEEVLTRPCVRGPFNDTFRKGLCLVPYWDLPGRIRGFCGVSGNSAGLKWRFRRIDHYGEWQGDRWASRDSGLAMLSAAAEHHPDFGDKVFVIDNLTIALHLHDRHFVDSSKTLPVLSAPADDKYRPNFQSGALASRKLIFWSAKAGPEILRMAKDADGWIATGDHPTRFIRANRSSLIKPAVWLQAVADAAVPWQEAVETKINSLPSLEAESLLQYLEFTPAQRAGFARKCHERVSNRLSFTTAVVAEVRVGQNLVQERDGAWYTRVDKKESRWSPLSDAILRIDQVVTGKNPLYRGRVIFKETESKFTCLMSAIDRDPFEWMRNHLLETGQGIPTCLKMFTKDVVPIALQLSPPETVQAIEHYGWVEEQAMFAFQKFAISGRGELLEAPASSVDTGTAPTRGLTFPEFLDPEDIAALSRQAPTVQLAWATIICLLSNLLSPARNHHPSGIALVGETAGKVGERVASLAGCVRQTLKPNRRTSPISFLDDNRGWPVIVTPHENCSRSTLDWLSTPGGKNCLLQTDWYSAQALVIAHGWHMIEHHAGDPSLLDCEESIPKIIPLYLRDLCQRRLSLPQAESLAESVRTDLAKWFSAQGGAEETVLRSTRFLSPDCSSSSRFAAFVVDHFASLLCRAYSDGELTEQEDGFGRQKHPGFVLVGEDRLFISRVSFQRVLSRRNTPLVDSAIITRALSEQGLLLSEKSPDDRIEGWVVAKEWWDKKWESWFRKNGMTLKVVG